MNDERINPALQTGDEIEPAETVAVADTSVAEARWLLGSVLATFLIICLLGFLSSLV